MDFTELVERRQSDRHYNDKPVTREDIEKCLRAATLAPSDHNTQPWKFIVVDDPDLTEKVGAAAAGFGMNNWAHKSPVIVAVLLDQPMGSFMGGFLLGKNFALMDIGMAVENFCLQASELGLGTCILGSFDERKIKKMLGVPRGIRMPLMITMGYPRGLVRTKKRKGLDEVVSYNKYSK